MPRWQNKTMTFLYKWSYIFLIPVVMKPAFILTFLYLLFVVLFISAKNIQFTYFGQTDTGDVIARFVTSWSTTEEELKELEKHI